MAEIRLSAPLRRVAGGAEVLDEKGKDLNEVIANIDAKFPGFKERILGPDRDLKPTVLVFVNFNDIRSLKGLRTPLREDDIVSILNHVIGG